MRSSRHGRRRFARSLCAQLGPDDGIDPRSFSRGSHGRIANRKARQLCAQISETLSLVLQGECDDDLLRDLLVESVVPAPDSTRLLVTVAPSPAAGALSPGPIMERLAHATGKLRSEVAGAINRKKVPELIFRVGWME